MEKENIINDLKIKLSRHLGKPLEGTYGEKTQNDLIEDIMKLIDYIIITN